MNSAWTRHLQTEEEKAEFEQRLQNSKRVLQRLESLIDGELRNLENSELSIKAYESPSWAYLEADKIGYRRCAKFIKRLLDLDQNTLTERKLNG